jgi:hypothetical protein
MDGRTRVNLNAPPYSGSTITKLRAGKKVDTNNSITYVILQGWGLKRLQEQTRKVQLSASQLTYLKCGFALVTAPTSISDALKSADNTVDRHVIAI